MAPWNTRNARHIVPALGFLLMMAGCAGLGRDDPGRLQPQTVSGPCDVKKFFLLARTAVHTDMTLHNTGEACTFTAINPNLQAFPTAVLVTGLPVHGQVTAGLTNGGRSAIVAYKPQPGYQGEDRFTITIEPDDHAIAVAVQTGIP